MLVSRIENGLLHPPSLGMRTGGPSSPSAPWSFGNMLVKRKMSDSVNATGMPSSEPTAVTGPSTHARNASPEENASASAGDRSKLMATSVGSGRPPRNAREPTAQAKRQGGG